MKTILKKVWGWLVSDKPFLSLLTAIIVIVIIFPLIPLALKDWIVDRIVLFEIIALLLVWILRRKGKPRLRKQLEETGVIFLIGVCLHLWASEYKSERDARKAERQQLEQLSTTKNEAEKTRDFVEKKIDPLNKQMESLDVRLERLEKSQIAGLDVDEQIKEDISNAETFIFEGKLKEAELLIKNIQAKTKSVIEAQAMTEFLNSDIAHWSGNDSVALIHLERAIVLKRNFPAAWNNRGVALMTFKRAKEALFCFDTALFYKHDYLDAWSSRGAAFVELDEYREAIASQDSALRIDSTFATAWYNRGIAWGKLKESDSAIVNYTHAIYHNRKYKKAWFNRGLEFGNLGAKYRRAEPFSYALADFDQAISLDSNYVKAWHNKALALWELKKYDEGIASAQKVLEILPINSPDRKLTELMLADFQGQLARQK